MNVQVILTDDQLDALAERVAAKLDIRRPGAELVDAQTLATRLGVSRDTVYARADELGGRRIGNGSRPRLRFDLETALAAWEPRPPRRARPRRRKANGDGLLPIAGAR